MSQLYREKITWTNFSRDKAHQKILHQVEDIGNDTPYYKGRLVDPTGAISVYAGQYQPDAVRSIEELEVPVWVAIIGKISIFTTEDGTKIPSIRAESISKIDEDAIRTFTYMAASNMITHIEHETTDMKTKAIELYGDLTSEYKAEAVTALKSLLPPSGD